ncbi:dUTP pyrophosphatase [Pancytospora epiphaga]|nr:dUTP pyrophosphatase [Pancytospora epiphaga]
MSVLNVQPVRDDSILPTFSQTSSYTLYANSDVQLEAGKVACVKTGFRLSFPSTYCALNVSCNGLTMLGGLIDSDFRGEVSAICISPVSRTIKRGEPIARMVILEIETVEIEVEETAINYETRECEM